MKILYLLLITCVFASCQSNSAREKTIHIKPAHKLPIANKTILSNKSNNKDTASAGDEMADQYVTYYVVVADTGADYDVLRNKMFKLHQVLNAPIDTMGRTYNKAKNLIALPENADDEMFAGNYYPRRTPSNSLSLEYLSLYKDGAKEKTIALVTGIFETKTSADSVLKAIGSENAFAIKANIYQGCIH